MNKNDKEMAIISHLGVPIYVSIRAESSEVIIACWSKGGCVWLDKESAIKVGEALISLANQLDTK